MNVLRLISVLFCCSCLLGSQYTTAQEIERIPTDSTNVYNNIYDFSRKNGFSKFVYKLLFRSVKDQQAKAVNPFEKKTETLSNVALEGKIIRNIKIETLDPFGYSVSDTTKVPKKGFENFGNDLHIKTKDFTIKNLLLFKKNDRLDLLLTQESERLIRSQRYVRQVKIEAIPIANNPDSVDVVVRALDTWSLIPNGNLSNSKMEAKLTERNLIGLGHQLSGTYKTRFEDKEKAVDAQYVVTNIKNSFIRFSMDYANDFDNNSVRSIGLVRNFYSPVAKWAGGAYFENRLRRELFRSQVDTVFIANVKSEFQEYWVGRSFPIASGKSYNSRTQRLILSTLVSKRQFLQTPDASLDPVNFFANERNWLIQTGITSQKYYKDKFIFNYDIEEDIPYGEIFALTFGFQERQERSRFYFGSRIGYGKKFTFGYLSSSAEWGSFFDNNTAEQTAFRLYLDYFSPLMAMGKWRVRQFIKPSYVWGNNRENTEKDQLTLNENFGIQGFNSPIFGTQKWLLSLQTQTYSPGSWHGFRFSPYLNMTFGALSDTNRSLFQSKVYSKLGIGVLINNDYLVFNSFQISFSYYPTIPFEGDNLFRTNSFENTDLNLSDFQLSKPAYINYQ